MAEHGHPIATGRSAKETMVTASTPSTQAWVVAGSHPKASPTGIAIA